MISSGQSDLAIAMGLRMQNTRIRAALDVASQELATGQKSNLNEATAGDLGKLFSVDRTLKQLSSEGDAINLALGKSSLTQLTIGHIQDSMTDYGPQLLSAVERGDQLSMRLLGNGAEDALGAMISALNTRYGRHSLFSGAAVDKPTLAPVEDLLSDVKAIVAGSVDANAALTAIDDYFFTPGGGFETNIYRGSTQDAPPFRDINGNDTEYALRGDSLQIRESLRALAITAVASEFSGPQDQSDMLRVGAKSSISATSGIIELRGELGNSEAQLSEAQARNQAKRGFMELERSAILSADPYETATRFEALQVQLQSVYTLTARLSGLSLTNYLR